MATDTDADSDADPRRRWNPATDPAIDEAIRERYRAVEMAIGHVSDHVYRKWARRAPAHTECDVVTAWHDGEPVHYPSAANGAVARYHRESDMLVLARMGALVSTVPLGDRPRDEQQYVRNQVTSE
ncbi:hypothetical protein [Salinilacihabitans rarus]|uniref:hypothetical protein n=1 Tax=Salinilacihabitans rarus TaxID=2961596 RepID=UPI0020C90098|nr:hypothetical protein [Salinilacihabitans rarus]